MNIIGEVSKSLICLQLTRLPEVSIGINGGLNLYGYVYNNPVNSWDPLGLESDGLTVPLDELDGAGPALDKMDDIIDAGDNMGEN